MATEYIAVVQERTGKVLDFAICNSLELARRYADKFASKAMVHSVVTIFQANAIEKQGGQIPVGAFKELLRNSGFVPPVDDK